MQSGIEFSREETLEVLHSIAAFLKNHQCLWRAHVVEFFQDRLWEDIDIQWWDDLQRASLQDLLWLPSGKFQDTWCASLKDFLKTAQSLALFRQPGMDLERIFPGLSKPKISSVLRQGMNFKKLHEVEVLSAVVNRLAQAVHATHIVDVGAGQGYLAQVLAFEYGLPVMALDACAHHANVTNERSERIKKHYMSCSRTSKQDCTRVTGPQTATFHVMSGNNQMELQNFLSNLGPERLSSQTMDDGYTKNGKVLQGESCFPEEKDVTKQLGSSEPEEKVNSFVLAGLHACGDLSVTMLQTYMMCEEVKAVVTVGCCYNLLTENDDDEHASGNAFGFPLSDGVKGLGLSLGRRARDLACQSADRWKDVGMESAMYNFQQHALRAGFQLVLHKYHPELAELNPTVGRLGKARRRKQVKRHSMVKNTNNLILGVKISTGEAHDSSSAIDLMSSSERKSRNSYEDIGVETNKVALNDRDGGGKRKEFIEFARAAFERLGLESVAEKDLEDIWKGIEPKSALIGPYWSLRAVLGPVLETYMLLDRLLYLQEQLPPVTTDVGPLKGLSGPSLVALFDPEISPRNMAILVMRE